MSAIFKGLKRLRQLRMMRNFNNEHAVTALDNSVHLHNRNSKLEYKPPDLKKSAVGQPGPQ